jgi:hypothetical protein
MFRPDGARIRKHHMVTDACGWMSSGPLGTAAACTSRSKSGVAVDLLPLEQAIDMADHAAMIEILSASWRPSREAGRRSFPRLRALNECVRKRSSADIATGPSIVVPS